jgi:ABC-type uncharacterized transport system permease subunit
MQRPLTSPRFVRSLAWGGTAALTLLPLAAMKALDPNAWAAEDLPFAFVLIAAVGIAAEVALRLPSAVTRRAGTLLALGTAALLMWGNLAVGFAGSEDNKVNLLLFAVPAVALAGSLLAQFRPAEMAAALVATAGAQLLAGLALLAAGHFTGPLTVAFTGLWLVSALLFHRSMRETARA